MLHGDKIRVKDLEREIEYMKKEHELDRQKIRTECLEQRLQEASTLKVTLAEREVRIEQLEVRIKESPYAQLTDLLKALMVKLPTLNIQELSVRGKEK